MTGRVLRAVAAVVAVVSAVSLFALAPGTTNRATAGPDDPTDSALTLTGRPSRLGDDFSSLTVTVSQTKALSNQAISVTWTGGAKSAFSGRDIMTNYLQIMQCSGADPQAPDFRETCVWGAGIREVGTTVPREENRKPVEEAVVPDALPADARMIPFYSQLDRARTPDGSSTSPFPDSKVAGTTGPAYNWEVLSNYFTPYTTNEVSQVPTGGDGTGRATFEVRNASRDPHLGCGKVVGDGPRACWLAVVPRGAHDVDGSVLAAPRHRSPLTTAVFGDALFFPLEFVPVEAACRSGAERRTVGTQFIGAAMQSWQPALCAGNGPIFGFSHVGDAEGGAQVLEPFDTAPGLAFTAEPVVPAEGQWGIVHAPVAVSAAVITFNIDFRMDPAQGEPPAEVAGLRGTPVRDLRLTPRLVAKLLTQSYQRDLPNGEKVEHLKANRRSIVDDPEFLQLNPSLAFVAPSHRPLGIMVPNGNYAYAREVWRWILADPEAKAWMQGTPDESGMKVNPNYADFVAAPAEYFPKADQTCAPPPELPNLLPYQRPDVGPCAFEYTPYTSTIEDTAYQTLRADTKQQILWEPPANEGQTGNYKADAPQEITYRFVMGIADSASAARYGLHTAQLCRPARGTDGTLRPDDCRSATTASMVAATDAMVPTDIDNVRAIDPAKVAATTGAYPLTMVTYAAAALNADTAGRKDYATLLRYAAGAGQTPGFQRGQLPPGYAPLPQAMRAQTERAANEIQNFVYVPPTEEPGADTGTQAPAGGTTPPASVPNAGVPPPSSGGSSSAPPAVTTSGVAPGNPLGVIRMVLVVLLVAGGVGAVAGPGLLAYARAKLRRAGVG
ncbi:hypothetical protein [Virgisporangium aurantiacum]|uniref:PBP domain-containing protein n=1 Tax=Virgisporangium aurantiacum TaxID=175570 RepID=A0A8J3Z389_9ACTN|nr:hypothetical protein [Virgisporangium aurantiacum]GIJ54215.1 hypothetical protein Vau01_017310 [Virgisporangium aurantiacum]